MEENILRFVKKITALKSIFGFRQDAKKQIRFPYAGRDQFHRLLPQSKDDLVFVGDSHISMFPLEELLQNLNVKNRGYGGSNSYDLLSRIKFIAEGLPSKIFISIGINDISQNIEKEISFYNLYEIIKVIKNISPNTQIHLLSLFPVWKNKGDEMSGRIKEYNVLYENICKQQGLFYINAYEVLKEQNGFMNLTYTTDGVHLNGYGYFVLRDIIALYIK